MIFDLVLLVLGLVVITAGAEVLVRGGSSLAQHFGMTPLVVGLTVVAFGTSAPEMVVSIGGSWLGHGDIAVGNIVGSNIFNVGFILAFTALVCPITIHLGILKLEAPLILGLSLLTVWLIHLGTISRLSGFILLVLLVCYTVWSVRLAKKQTTSEIEQEFDSGVPKPTRSFYRDSIFILSGLALLFVGSKVFLGSATSIARRFEISEAIIGLTIVAAGTSMPELATSIVAAFRKQSDIAVGNILGSCIFNILGVLGLSSVVKPLNAPNILPLDLWTLVALAFVMLSLFWTGRKLQRWEGGLLLCGYLTYLWLRWPI